MREPDRIIRLKTVLSRTGLSRSTIYRKIAEGTFPAQLKISANGTGRRRTRPEADERPLGAVLFPDCQALLADARVQRRLPRSLTREIQSRTSTSSAII